MTTLATAEAQRTQSYGMQAAWPTGQRLKCDLCGAEIEVIKPCPSQPPDQVLRCCGKDMHPAP
jgi:hypothetical protein